MARKIKKNDQVKIISGSAKGSTGVVLSVDTKRQKVIVAGANMGISHEKPSVKNPEGGRISRERPVHISNVAFLDSKTQQVTRVGFRFESNGQKVRFSKKSGEVIDVVSKTSREIR